MKRSRNTDNEDQQHETQEQKKDDFEGIHPDQAGESMRYRPLQPPFQSPNRKHRILP